MSNFPIFVIEGPDGSGKTTLCNKLAEYLGDSKYIHLTYRFKDRMFDYHTAAIELCLKYARHKPVILDRWWPSEKIYADVFRGGSKWPLGGRLLDRVALKHGVTYVFCVPSDQKAYYERFDKLKESRDEMFSTMQGVYEAYADLYRTMGPRFDAVHYDIDSHGRHLDEYCKWVIDHAWSVKDIVAPEWLDPENRLVAGNSYRPKILLVGDQSNPKTRRDVWPFFEHGNSSLWITEALQKLGINEDKLAWVNSREADGVVADLNDYVEETAPTHIVALGHSASNALCRCSIEHAMIKHPQWYRRFAPNDLTDLEFMKGLISV